MSFWSEQIDKVEISVLKLITDAGFQKQIFSGQLAMHDKTLGNLSSAE